MSNPTTALARLLVTILAAPFVKVKEG
jgi:hypothetical protein